MGFLGKYSEHSVSSRPSPSTGSFRKLPVPSGHNNFDHSEPVILCGGRFVFCEDSDRRVRDFS